ncbi:unnamed protein product, partial [Taenia asiatica]|uniref:GPI ethanolamine phosphate transferase 1 n=1 Tax=Taenia asiatica TaxID=60517 RepID=A0A0R3WBQ4_TAEAS
AFLKSDLPKFVEQDRKIDDGRCGKLIFLHLSSVDDVAHRVGAKDSLFYQTVDNADKVVEKVYHHFRLSLSREDLATTAFIVTADHGTKPEGMPIIRCNPIFWTISMVFLSLALAINLTDSQSCIPRSKIRFYTRLGIFGLASIELYRDYNKEPNYREMNILSFGCIVCEFFLCGYATVGRKLLVKLFKSTGPQRGQILRFLLAILQAYLTVRGFDEPRHFVAAGALLVADLVFDETVRRKGKHRFTSHVRTFTHSFLVHIHSPGQRCEDKSDFLLGLDPLGATYHAIQCILYELMGVK